MSINALEAFNARYSESEPSNDYVASDRSYTTVNDNNGGSYSSWINFNSISMVGKDLKKTMNFSSAFLMVPYGACAHISSAGGLETFGTTAQVGGVTTSTLAKNDAMLLAPKGVHHLFSQMAFVFGGTPIHQAIGNLNIYINEQLKAMNADQQRMFCDLLGHAWDSSESYSLDRNVLERNNSIFDSLTFASGLDAGSFANKGHRERIVKNNVDITDYNMRSGLGASGALANNNGVTLQSVLSSIMSPSLVGVYDNTGTAILPSTAGIYQTAADRRITTLVFQYVAIVPLSILSNFIKEMPTIATCSNFELRLLPNLGPNNSWSVTYGNAAATMVPIETASMQSQGETCPFMLSAVSSNGSTGCTITGDGCTITVSPYVGYYTSAPNIAPHGIAGRKVTSHTQLPCQMYIPSTNLTDAYSSMLADNPKRRVLYNDFFADTIERVPPYQTTTRQLQNQLGRLRKLYIIPYLSTDSALDKNKCCDPRQSLVSSAPNTCSFAKITNLNVYVGSVNVFVTPQSMEAIHYLSGPWMTQGITNGNDFKSPSMQGMVRLSDFKRCYGSLVVDLERVTDGITDDMLKSVQVVFKNDTGLVMDYLILTEYQVENAVDRVNGQVVSLI